MQTSSAVNGSPSMVVTYKKALDVIKILWKKYFHANFRISLLKNFSAHTLKVKDLPCQCLRQNVSICTLISSLQVMYPSWSRSKSLKASLIVSASSSWNSANISRVVGQYGTGQFGIRQFGTKLIKNGQFSTKEANGPFGSKIRK